MEDGSRKPTQLPLPAKDFSSASENRQYQIIRDIQADHFSAKCLPAACDFTDKHTPELPQPSSGLISDYPGPHAFIPPTLPALCHSHQRLYIFIRLLTFPL